MGTKHLLFLAGMLLSFSAAAEKIELDGIYYNLGNGTAEVTYRGDEEDGWMYFNYDELYTGNVVIPESITYNGTTYQVNAIGNDAFAGSKIMTSLHLPSTIKTMGSGIFSLCNGLAQITVDDDNTEFFSYDGLLYTKKNTELYFVPKGIWGEVTLLDGISTIPLSAFQNCTGITTVTIPETVTEIADGAFYGCSSLEEIFFNDKLTTIGEYAFGKCTNLQIVNFPESLKTIKTCAFLSCRNLYYALLHEGITSIGKMAFYDCENLMGIELPSTLTSIAEKAFMGCYNLGSIKNKSKLKVEAGQEDNGYVAYYATEIIEETGIANTTSDTPTILFSPAYITIGNANGRHYAVYDYSGRLQKKGVCRSNEERIATNGKQLIVSVE